jgi:hypothetical protein
MWTGVGSCVPLPEWCHDRLHRTLWQHLEWENKKGMSRKRQNNRRIREKSVDDYTIQVRGGSSLIKKCKELFGCSLFTAVLRQPGALGSESCTPPRPSQWPHFPSSPWLLFIPSACYPFVPFVFLADFPPPSHPSPYSFHSLIFPFLVFFHFIFPSLFVPYSYAVSLFF